MRKLHAYFGVIIGLQSKRCVSTKNFKKINIKKMLIANRGEIVCRIIKTAKKLGIRTVAVYSEADKNSVHVDMADEAYCIGRPLSSESYLMSDKILSVAKHTQSDAIHPGYGFLSESAEFADDCYRNNITFIGPPASAIRDMGIKSTSKVLMESANVPVIPGYHKEDQSDDTLIKEADKIGYPIMIKAVRGGGGKGMRIAMKRDDFTSQMSSARSEAMKSFGDDALLLERLILNPRHIEVQVFGDHYNNYVYLFERDCSVQRRHQKIIEEAPAPGLSDELREELGTAAVRAAEAVGYVGAGTVEFIFDIDSNKFYFMEMNTRLQVEHPITEMITGTDLVQWQILVASGQELPLSQNELKIYGHSVEARIYAEDPFNDFLPDAGKLSYLKFPFEISNEVRVETGVKQGDDVSVYYDPMIAKLVVWAQSRSEAFDKLYRNLLDFHVGGVSTNIEFLLKLIMIEDMQNGDVHTGFIDQHKKELFDKSVETDPDFLIQCALAVVLLENSFAIESIISSKNPYNPFVILNGFRVNHKLMKIIKISDCHNGKKHDLPVTYINGNSFMIQLDKKNILVSASLINNGATFILNTDIKSSKSISTVFKHSDEIYLFDKKGFFKCKYYNKRSFNLDDSISSINNEATSPMPGTVDKILINDGVQVKSGDPLLTVMAMKMEHVIKSPKDGVVDKILYKPGDNVEKDEPLVIWRK